MAKNYTACFKGRNQVSGGKANEKAGSEPPAVEKHLVK